MGHRMKGIWKVHDDGKVTSIWNVTDDCEVSNHAFSYERIGLYYKTKKGPQHFCNIHLAWGTLQSSRYFSMANYTKPGDSVMEINPARYDPTALRYLPENLDLASGGNVVYYGDPRPDAELRDEAKTFQGGDERYKDLVGKHRKLECWLLGPVTLFQGDNWSGSIVAKLDGRFENGQGYQHCTLWESHYIDDGTLQGVHGPNGDVHTLGGWRDVEGDKDATEQIRNAISKKALPPYATGVAWKLEQYKTHVSSCQAKGLSD
jgi:hypothetical protein